MKKFCVEFNIDSEKNYAEFIQFMDAKDKDEAVEKVKAVCCVGHQFFLFDVVEMFR